MRPACVSAAVKESQVGASASVRAAAWAGPGRIASAADVQRALMAVNAAGGRRATTAELRQPVQRASAAGAQPRTVLPVHPLLAPLLPWPDGLPGGATVAVTGSMSLLLSIVGAAMTQGAWCAAVGLPQLGAVAALEHAVELDRFALVPEPGPMWPEAVAALVDGVALVALSVPGAVPAGTARSLAARARRRGCALVPVDTAWPGADLTLTATAHRWGGLGFGRGRLRHHEVSVSATGRGAAGRPRTAALPMPMPATPAAPAPASHSAPGLAARSA